MANNFQELHLLLAQTPREYRTGLREIIGAPAGDSPAVLCDHLCSLRTGAGGKAFDPSDYKQLVTDIADKVDIDWSAVIGLSSWAALPAGQIEAAIVRHVDGDKIYGGDEAPQLPPAKSALDEAFSSLGGDWRKLLAAVIYIHQVIRPSPQEAAPRRQIAGAEPRDVRNEASPGSRTGHDRDRALEDFPPDEDSAAPPVARKTGAEALHAHSEPLGPTLLDFWRWSASDLLSHAVRGALAVYIVSCALGLDDGVRGDDGDVLLHPDGLRIAVQSASYLEAGPYAQDALVRFPIRSARLWDSSANVLDVNLTRLADLHVFCLLAHPDAETVDPLDVSQWQFYVVESTLLDAKFPLGESVGLTSLRGLGVLPIPYGELLPDVAQYVAPSAAREG
jgi:hypothetical protein